MTYSEEILERVLELCKNGELNLFEATVEICESYNLEPEEFIQKLDANFLERLKYEAVRGRHVQKKVHGPIQELF